MSAEFFDFLIQRKTGRLSRDFEQHAARFPEIDRMKISPIYYRCDVVAEIDKTLAPLELFGFVLRSKSNVMHRTGSDTSHRAVGLTEQVYDSAWGRIIRRCEPETISRF